MVGWRIDNVKRLALAESVARRIATVHATMLEIRPAQPADLPEIVTLIRELAEYERLLDQCGTNVEMMHEALFGPKPHAEALVALAEGTICGTAIYFTNFSTFKCRPGLYLEDLYVRPSARGRGLGRAMLVELARIAVQRNYGRMEWSVLDWNEPAIGFYKSLGAVAMNEWTVFRVTDDALTNLAKQT
jgi:GNAT superfamily N-acetyltransferase